ncbi:MAG: D-allose transporter substrate-binding protein [Bacillota bacterium]
MRGLSRIVGALVIVMLLGSVVSAPVAAAQRPLRIGILLKTLANPFWVSMKEGIEQEAAKLGIQVDIYAVPTEGDLRAQAELLETMLQKGYDGLGVAPISPVNLIPGVAKATAMGIPVVNIDEAIDKEELRKQGGFVYSFVTTNNFKVGEQAGEFVVKSLGPQGGEVAIIEGAAGNKSGNDRRDGFRSVVERNPRLKLVASQPANWDRMQALNVATNLLQRFPRLRAIYCANDTMALGAVQAVINAGKQNQVIVVGTDGIPEAVQAVKEGRLAATIAQDPAGIGAESLRLLVQALSIPQQAEVPSKLITR